MADTHEADVSTEFGVVPLPYFLQVWSRPDAIHFRYRHIRIVPSVISILLGILWAYYVYTVVNADQNMLMLVLFGIILGGLSFVTLLRLMRWRIFTRRSAVALTDDALAWRQGATCYLVPWKLIEPDMLGLENLAFSKSYDTFLTIKVGEHAAPLYLIRLYARLENREAFFAEFLKRIPKERWKKNKRKNKAPNDGRA